MSYCALLEDFRFSNHNFWRVSAGPQVGREGNLPGGARGGQDGQGRGSAGPLPVRVRRRGRGLRAGGMPAEVHLPVCLRGRRRAGVPARVGRHHQVRGASGAREVCCGGDGSGREGVVRYLRSYCSSAVVFWAVIIAVVVIARLRHRPVHVVGAVACVNSPGLLCYPRSIVPSFHHSIIPSFLHAVEYFRCALRRSSRTRDINT